jgi:hypothetical protein
MRYLLGAVTMIGMMIFVGGLALGALVAANATSVLAQGIALGYWQIGALGFVAMSVGINGLGRPVQR